MEEGVLICPGRGFRVLHTILGARGVRVLSLALSAMLVPPVELDMAVGTPVLLVLVVLVVPVAFTAFLARLKDMCRQCRLVRVLGC